MSKNMHKMFDTLRGLMNPIPVGDRYKADPFAVVIGGYVSIKGHLCKVEDIYTYSYKKEKWNEFKLYDIVEDKTIFLEFEMDDTLSFSLSEDKLPTRRMPVTYSEIEYMVDAEKGSFEFEGNTFYYEDDYFAKFRRMSDPDKKEKVAIYEFESEDGECFTVERWNEDDFEAFHSVGFNARDFEIISLD